MAKRDNMPPEDGGLTGGLNFGVSREVKEKQKTMETGSPNVHTEPSQATSIVENYQNTMKHQERRSVKFNVLITPNLQRKLDRAVERGEIRSRNDLINHLLEVYFEAANNGAR